ncbi:MAG TPA: 30S ribosomal protein S7, partial [Ktedonobacterales bacterium]|nr:30S ribosomal protein S7 [Ktedonobacterales bacterium]
MPRRTKVQHRVVLPDPKYNNRNITRLIGRMMWDGKRSLAERIIYDALDIIEERSKRNPVEVFEQA